MATEIIQVAANTSPDLWTTIGNPSKVVCVNSPDDDDTTYIRASVNGRQQQFSLLANSIPLNAVINTVSVISRARRTGVTSTQYSVSLLIGADVTTSSNITAFNGVYTTITSTLSRPGGGTWAVADIGSLQLRVNKVLANAVNLTTFYVNVNYTVPSTVTVTYDTDSYLAPSTTEVTNNHTTDSYGVVQSSPVHTTDSLLVVQSSPVHTTDSLLVVQSGKMHTSDSFKLFQFGVSHTTDVYLRTKLQKMYVAFIGNSPMKDFVELDSKIL